MSDPIEMWWRVPRGRVHDAVFQAVRRIETEQSELLNFIKVAGPQAAREGNKNIIGMGVIAPNLERTLIWMVDRYPWFKSYLAKTMYAGKERIPAEIGFAAGEAAQSQQRK